MAGNDDLHPILKNINKTLSKVRTDIQKLTGEVKKLPEILENGFKKVQDAINDNIQAQAELKMMEHMAEVSAVEPQIEAEKTQITQIEADLNDRLDGVSERYQRKHDELDETAEERIRDLGSHIFEIEEQQFKAGIEDPFTTQLTPVWRTLQAHNDETRDKRQTKVSDKAETVSANIDSFIDRKDQLIQQIDDHLLDLNSQIFDGQERTKIQFPYYVIEKRVDGDTEQVVVPPSDFVSGQFEETAWSSAILDPLPGTPDLADSQRTVDSAHSTTEPVDQQAILSSLEKHSSESSLGLSYVDAVADTMANDIQITVEGGAD